MRDYVELTTCTSNSDCDDGTDCIGGYCVCCNDQVGIPCSVTSNGDYIIQQKRGENGAHVRPQKLNAFNERAHIKKIYRDLGGPQNIDTDHISNTNDDSELTDSKPSKSDIMWMIIKNNTKYHHKNPQQHQNQRTSVHSGPGGHHKRYPIDYQPCSSTRSCCGIDCSDSGVCQDGVCFCAPGYVGTNCEIRINNNDCGDSCDALVGSVSSCLLPVCNRFTNSCILIPKTAGTVCTVDNPSNCVSLYTCDGIGSCVARDIYGSCTPLVWLSGTVLGVVVVGVLTIAVVVALWGMMVRKRRRRRSRHSTKRSSVTYYTSA